MATKIFSQEDGNLDAASIVVTRDMIYKDIDLSFNKRTTGDIYKKTEAAAVKQAIKTLISTNRFDKPFNPDFGADIRSMLFELADENSGTEIITRIKNAIQKYEPRAAAQEISVKVSNYNSIDVSIIFQILNTDQMITYETTVSRLV
jgi:phage baseplate assembly protein W